MNGFQTMKKQLLPLVKGSPFIALVFFLSWYTARKIISYSDTMYQSIGRIKLDDQKYGFSNNALYKDFDVFTVEHKVEAEVEVFKSPLIVSQALDSLDFNVSLYRKGKMKNTMLYHDGPFSVEQKILNPELYDRVFNVIVHNKEDFSIFYDYQKETHIIKGKFNQPIIIEGGQITLNKEEERIENNGLDLIGEYEFKIYSRESLITYVSDKLDVSAYDKEVPVLRIVYKDQHPKKVSKLINAISKAYIYDYIANKAQAAAQTQVFLDVKLQEVAKQLDAAERELEAYKQKNDVVNTLQETETGLREISKLKVQLINLEVNESAVLQLEEYIRDGDYFEATAINFGFGDLLMTELVKKLKLWNDERLDLLVRYTPENEKVLAVDKKIAEIKSYIKEAIKQNKNEIITKRKEVKAAYDLASKQFETLPRKERDLEILMREFRLQESVYNFLSQKKVEASIASTANIAFHRIIQKAVTPKEPISPNKVLITFVTCLFGLITAITLVYLWHFVKARIVSRDDIEKNSMLPIAGIIRKGDQEEDFLMLARSLQLKGLLASNSMLSVCSTLRGEGKSYVSIFFSKALVSLGYSVVCLDAGLVSTNQALEYTPISELKIKANQKYKYVHLDVSWEVFINQYLENLKKEFDFVVVDSPACALDILGIQIMANSDLTLYLFRANHTTVNYASHPDVIKEEYQLKNMFLLLNYAHKASNFSGDYLGKRFRYNVNPKGFINKFKYYLNTYIL